MSRLHEIPLFQNLSEDELQRLSAIMTNRELADGEILFRQGDPSTHAYIVRRGTVRIFAVVDGVEETFTSLTMGGIFGEIGVIKGSERTASAVAEGIVHLIELEGDAFRELTEECPNISKMVLQTMVGRFKADQARQHRRASRPATKGRILPLFSATGGAGTTTLVANLAGYIKEITKKSVAVLDLDLMFGDIGPVCGIDGGFTLSELILAETIDDAAVEEIAQKTRVGVDVYQAPAKPEDGEFVAAGFVDRLLTVLANRYDYVLCDTTRRLYDVTLDLYEMSRTPILVVTPEVTSIRNAARWIDVVKRIGLPIEGLKILVNKVGEADQTSVEYVKKKLPGQLLATLPLDETARTSGNLGKLLLEAAPNSPLAGGLRKAAGALVGVEISDTSAKSSFWQRWL